MSFKFTKSSDDLKREKEESKIDETLYGLFVFLNAVIILLVLLILFAFWAKYSFNQALTAIAGLLMISGAYLLGGAIVGFLFAIPRSGTFRYKPGNENPNSWYDDNTNLEEISDWLTKIIVGITLVQFDKIQYLLDVSARSIAASFLLQDCKSGCAYYSWAYGLIIFFVAIGFVISYLWTRINFALILTVSRKRLSEITTFEKKKEQLENAVEQKEALLEKKQTQLEQIKGQETALTNTISSIASQNAVQMDADVVDIDQLDEKTALGEGATPEFTKMVAEKLAAKPVTVSDDMQKNRWGGKVENGGKKIEATVTASKLYVKFFDIRIRVYADENSPTLKGWVAFFVHDSLGFKNDTVYAKVNEKGIAEIPLVAYEAFTAGALTEDGTELEIDLNEQPGYPDDFYWE
ncbi:pYEATS domain-containing protein [Flavihumibacter petaseus]|uniref:Prokaryotic YEATS domain-containing protein n=1 Tax=Flavihumibacter petaseus NBRC 106054 TaxID=1220578 RepID=A0A0E9N359_9BACT|nr:pYEATS domain-containing protein [Flavihumibacter petaseus]GAO44106.1 hypothetical protein FPE01S_03_01450 [Flavihumibacter petaseus NBRC 106054]